MVLLYIGIKNVETESVEGKHVPAGMCQFVFSVAGILNFHQRHGARQAEEVGGQSDENKGREKKLRRRRRRRREEEGGRLFYWHVDPRLGTKPLSHLSCMHMLSLSL